MNVFSKRGRNRAVSLIAKIMIYCDCLLWVMQQPCVSIFSSSLENNDLLWLSFLNRKTPYVTILYNALQNNAELWLGFLKGEGTVCDYAVQYNPVFCSNWRRTEPYVTIPSRMLQESLVVLRYLLLLSSAISLLMQTCVVKAFVMVLSFLVVLALALSLLDDMNIPHLVHLGLLQSVMLFLCILLLSLLY